MNADGSNPRQITNLSTEAGGVLFSPDGKKLVFTSEVFPIAPTTLATGAGWMPRRTAR